MCFTTANGCQPHQQSVQREHEKQILRFAVCCRRAGPLWPQTRLDSNILRGSLLLCQSTARSAWTRRHNNEAISKKKKHLTSPHAPPPIPRTRHASALHLDVDRGGGHRPPNRHRVCLQHATVLILLSQPAPSAHGQQDHNHHRQPQRVSHGLQQNDWARCQNRRLGGVKTGGRFAVAGGE